MPDYPKPNELNPERMLEVAEHYLACGDFGAARFYGNFAIGIGLFDQQLVDNKSIIAPDASKTKQYLTQAKAVVRSATPPSAENLEARLKKHINRYDEL